METKRLPEKFYAFVLFVLFSVFFLVMPENAHAGYLDPGSGSTLVQGVIAFFASISRFFRRIGSIFSEKKHD